MTIPLMELRQDEPDERRDREVCSVRLTVWLTPQVSRKISSEAKRLGESKSHYARRLINMVAEDLKESAT